MSEILPNLHWIKGRASNVYLWMGEDRPALFDAGMPGDALNTRRDRLNCSEERISADIDAARQSARRLLRLTPAVIACGHGRPFLEHSAGDILMLDRALT